MLPVAQRLRSRGEFAVTMRTGRRAGGSAIVVHVLTGPHSGPGQSTSGGPDRQPSDSDPTAVSSRVGFVVPRTVGNAVVRNRVRRRLRHLMRPQLATLPAGTMVVVRVLPAAATLAGKDLASQLDQQLRSAMSKINRSRQRTGQPGPATAAPVGPAGQQ